MSTTNLLHNQRRATRYTRSSHHRCRFRSRHLCRAAVFPFRGDYFSAVHLSHCLSHGTAVVGTASLGVGGLDVRTSLPLLTTARPIITKASLPLIFALFFTVSELATLITNYFTFFVNLKSTCFIFARFTFAPLFPHYKFIFQKFIIVILIWHRVDHITNIY